MRLKTMFVVTLSLFAATFSTMMPVRADRPRIIFPINLPPTITSPSDNARVSSPLTVKGNAEKNRQVKVHVVAVYTGGEQDLGTFTATANTDGKWSTTPINLWLPEGAKNAKYRVSAVQVINDNSSQSRTITVLPPRNILYRPIGNIGNFVLKLAPQITSPAHDSRVGSPLRISGTASKNNEVKINVTSHYSVKAGRYMIHRQQDLGTFEVHANNDGKWRTSPVNLWLPEGAKNASFEIVASQKIGDHEYKSKTIKVLPPLNIRLVPLTPRILRFSPTITSPENNARVSSPLIIKGTAGNNRQVKVSVKATYTGGEQDLGTFSATADSHGKWHTTPITLWLPENARNAKYVVSAIQIVDDDPSLARTITLRPPLNVILRPIPLYPIISAPQITEPDSNEEVDSPLIIRGKGVAGRKIKVNVMAYWQERMLLLFEKDHDKDLGTFIVNVKPDGTWFSPKITIDLPDDANDIKFVITATQLFPGNKESSPVTVKVRGDD